jgi:hypothetical protein
MCSEAVIVIGFRNAMAQEESDLEPVPDFAELKANLDTWLMSIPDTTALAPEDIERRAERLSLGLEAR